MHLRRALVKHDGGMYTTEAPRKLGMRKPLRIVACRSHVCKHPSARTSPFTQATSQDVVFPFLFGLARRLLKHLAERAVILPCFRSCPSILNKRASFCVCRDSQYMGRVISSLCASAPDVNADRRCRVEVGAPFVFHPVCVRKVASMGGAIIVFARLRHYVTSAPASARCAFCFAY